MQEIWKPVKGNEDKYMVSNIGNVKSMDSWVKGRNSSYRFHKGRMLKGILSNGYYFVNINSQKRFIHRLVIEAFIKNENNCPCVNHKNGNPKDNNLNNLEWCTYSENTIHALNNKLTSLVGESHRDAKLTEMQVMEIYNSALSCEELSKIYKTTSQNVSNIKIGKIWWRVTGARYNKKNIEYISPELVLEIFNSPLSQIEITKKYGLKKSTANFIKTGKKHSRITGKVYTPIYKKPIYAASK